MYTCIHVYLYIYRKHCILTLIPDIYCILNPGLINQRGTGKLALELLCHKKQLVPSFFNDHMGVLSIDDSTKFITGVCLDIDVYICIH
jgi:hypothetical protein